MHTPDDLMSTARRMWLWPVAILVSFPIGGYVADLVVDGVDSVGAALVAGLIVGAVIGAGGVVRLAAAGLVALDPGDDRGNGCGTGRGSGPGRLRDRPSRPRPDGCYFTTIRAKFDLPRHVTAPQTTSTIATSSSTRTMT